MNGLEHRIRIIEEDLKDYGKRLNGYYDAVTVNPPYMATSSGDPNVNEHYSIARHEIHCTLEDVIEACSRAVRTGGKVSMVHRPSRFVEISETMRKWRLEPKRVQFIHPKMDKEANMVLIEAIRDGKPELRVLPPIAVYQS